MKKLILLSSVIITGCATQAPVYSPPPLPVCPKHAVTYDCRMMLPGERVGATVLGHSE